MPTATVSLPIIDLSSPDRSSTAKLIRQACTEHGFFYIVNHGLDKELLQRVFEESKNFFSLPLEEKLKYPRKEHRGYNPLFAEKLNPTAASKGDSKESFYIGPLGDPATQNLNQWPSHELLTKWRPTMESLYWKVFEAAKETLSLLAMSLNLKKPLEWSARQKIAAGAARGLRYLHEECRVGCIIHRDMRPNNILITHDFEPLVGDFGLARWQPDGDTGVETRVIGTFGYLAPEYAQSGQITEKADVYSFGVVLVELVTGRKAVDLTRPRGQQCLTEWARPLLEECAIEELIDPRLENCYSRQEVNCMLHAASLCIRRDPHSRPRMSQVLRILEGDMMMETNYISHSGYDVGNLSGRIWAGQHHYSGPLLEEESSESFSGKLSLEKYRTSSHWKRDKVVRTAREDM